MRDKIFAHGAAPAETSAGVVTRVFLCMKPSDPHHLRDTGVKEVFLTIMNAAPTTEQARTGR